MEYARNLYGLWSWLVPFRAVAETQNLAEASKRLHVAASALSRSVKLLEDRIGHPLFDRHPGGLQLNQRGHDLLASVREAMRLLDDGVARAKNMTWTGPVNLVAPGELAPRLLAALAPLWQEHPDLALTLRSLEPQEAVASLHRGEVDVALLEEGVIGSDEGLTFTPLAPHQRAVFVAPSHPAAARGAAALEALDFAVAVTGDNRPCDGFPSDVPRRVTICVASGAAVLELVRFGCLAAVLPRCVGDAAGFVAVEVGLALPPVHWAVVHRATLHSPGRAELIATALHAALMPADLAPVAPSLTISR